MTTVHTIDLDYLGTPGAIASYIVIGPDGPVMIETGPGSTVEALTMGLADLGFVPSDVPHVLVTHIHFDHAGASGWMARHGAHVHVHEFGRRHLIDPSRLNESARRIYGDSMDRRWGDLIPIPEEQVTAVHDGDVLRLGGVEIRAIETPGHARHHHVYALETDDAGRVAITGDVAATFVPEALPFVAPPTPPPEFDLETWIASLERLEREGFDRIYPTHFGPMDNPAGHLARVKTALRMHAERVRSLMDEGLEHATMLDRYTRWFVEQAEAAGMPPGKMGFYITDTIATMNLTGLVRYWTKRAEGVEA